MADKDGNKTSTVLAQFNTISEQIWLWDIKNQISFTFDTTSANTGVNSGSCKRVDEYLGHPVLWLGCWHHIPELMAKATWYTFFPDYFAPNNKFFCQDQIRMGLFRYEQS